MAEAISPKTMSKPSTYNASGRPDPDLVALAQFGIPLCTYGGCSGSGGTSASAPTIAGMLSLINDARMKKGKPSLGYINEKLYRLMDNSAAAKECFIDIGVCHWLPPTLRTYREEAG
jgi:tripeptidyl-peptidase-1